MCISVARATSPGVLTQTGVGGSDLSVVADGAIAECTHVCLCVNVSVWGETGETARYHFVCGCENAVSDGTAGVKWDVALWAAGVISSGLSRFVPGQLMWCAHTHLYVRTHISRGEKNRCTQPANSYLSCLSVSIWGGCGVNGCATHCSIRQKYTDTNTVTTDHWYSQWNKLKLTSQPVVSLLFQHNSTVHQPVVIVIAVICTLYTLEDLFQLMSGFSVAL